MQKRQQLYSNEQIRELEQIAITQHGIEESTLMQRAGTAAFDALKAAWPDVASITVFCGAGNNGGDGYVVAQLAHQAGITVQLIALATMDALHGAAKIAAQACHDAGVIPTAWDKNTTITGDVIVDALLGTGLTRDVSGMWHDVIEQINQQAQPVFALDVPSGLNSDTGAIHGIAVKAEHTMTFIGKKIGLYTGFAADYTGHLHCDTLGIAESAYATVSPMAETLTMHLGEYLPPRARSANKGDFGHVLVLGGNQGMPGAVRMVAQAALRTGAGRVTVATHPDNTTAVVARQAEIMCFGVSKTAELQPLLKKATVIVLGPGLGAGKWAKFMFTSAMQCDIPMIIDADGLNQLGNYLHPVSRFPYFSTDSLRDGGIFKGGESRFSPLKRKRKPRFRAARVDTQLALQPRHSTQWLLTPHPGEAARLLGSDATTVQHNRMEALQKIQQAFGGVCVLKGAGSLVSDGQLPIGVCPIASPAMATAGMGDVLSGVLAGLVAQGLSLKQAAELGVCLHAKAAVQAAMLGERGVLATDLLPYLHALVNEYDDVDNHTE